jgi:hypothetical protein
VLDERLGASAVEADFDSRFSSREAAKNVKRSELPRGSMQHEFHNYTITVLHLLTQQFFARLVVIGSKCTFPLDTFSTLIHHPAH